MTELQAIVTIGTACLAIIGPLLVYLAAQQSRLSREVSDERKARELSEQRERLLWGWARGLVDQVYKLGGVPIEPLDYLDDLFPTETRKVKNR